MPSSEPLEMTIDTFSIGAAVVAMLASSDAAAGLGDPGDAGGDLGRALREQLEQPLHRDPGGPAERPQRGAAALGQVLGPHEADDPPVLVGDWIDVVAGR